MLTGGCLCGSVRYEVNGSPQHAGNCHCSMCRRAAGAPFVAWFSVPRSQFRWVAGEPKKFQSSGKAKRGFCKQCGSQLTFEDVDYPQEIDVTTCSLDDPERAAPAYHIWTSSKLDWIRLADGLPEYRERRTQKP